MCLCLHPQFVHLAYVCVCVCDADGHERILVQEWRAYDRVTILQVELRNVQKLLWRASNTQYDIRPHAYVRREWERK